MRLFDWVVSRSAILGPGKVYDYPHLRCAPTPPRQAIVSRLRAIVNEGQIEGQNQPPVMLIHGRLATHGDVRMRLRGHEQRTLPRTVVDG
jgi:hypothetical protein